MIPSKLTSMLKTDKYQMIMINSVYKTASDEVNNQVDEINKIVKKYDKGALLVGESTFDEGPD